MFFIYKEDVHKNLLYNLFPILKYQSNDLACKKYFFKLIVIPLNHWKTDSAPKRQAPPSPPTPNKSRPFSFCCWWPLKPKICKFMRHWISNYLSYLKSIFDIYKMGPKIYILSLSGMALVGYATAIGEGYISPDVEFCFGGSELFISNSF